MILQTKSFPNHFKLYNFPKEIIQTLELTRPWEYYFYYLLLTQSILDFGVFSSTEVAISWVFNVSIQFLSSLFGTGLIIAIYFLLLIHFWEKKGKEWRKRENVWQWRNVIGFLGLLGMVFSVVIASGATIGSCCGAGSIAIFLSFLGADYETSLFFTKYSLLFGGIGIVILISNIAILAKKIEI